MDEEIGRVLGYFAVSQAAVIDLHTGSLRIGDRIWFRGKTTDHLETVCSLQLDRKPVSEAAAKRQVGIQVSAKVRRNDRVYRISA